MESEIDVPNPLFNIHMSVSKLQTQLFVLLKLFGIGKHRLDQYVGLVSSPAMLFRQLKN